MWCSTMDAFCCLMYNSDVLEYIRHWIRMLPWNRFLHFLLNYHPWIYNNRNGRTYIYVYAYVPTNRNWYCSLLQLVQSSYWLSCCINAFYHKQNWKCDAFSNRFGIRTLLFIPNQPICNYIVQQYSIFCMLCVCTLL